VTVIATGFEPESQLAAGEEVVPKTQIAKGTDSKHRDRLSFMRKVGSLEPSAMKGYTEEEWDVPAFLRRQGE